MTGSSDPGQRPDLPGPSGLSALLEALEDKRKCADRHSMRRQGCPECEADDMRGRATARKKLNDLAPTLAQLFLEAGETLTKVHPIMAGIVHQQEADSSITYRTAAMVALEDITASSQALVALDTALSPAASLSEEVRT